MKCKKLLVVDDDRIVLESCKRILETEGFTVVLVTSAYDAINKLEKSGIFDLMIMDVKMPKKDGVYLLKKIIEKWPPEKWPTLPVLVMSGYPTSETIKILIENGVKEFIPKPFTPDELLSSVYKLLKSSQNNKPLNH
jgi:DNA-binding NtrC family response regulator